MGEMIVDNCQMPLYRVDGFNVAPELHHETKV